MTYQQLTVVVDVAMASGAAIVITVPASSLSYYFSAAVAEIIMVLAADAAEIMVVLIPAGSSSYYCSAVVDAATTTMVLAADADANPNHILFKARRAVHETVLFSLIYPSLKSLTDIIIRMISYIVL